MASASEVGHYRAGMNNLLAKLVGPTTHSWHQMSTVALGSVQRKMLNQAIHYFSQLLLFSIC